MPTQTLSPVRPIDWLGLRLTVPEDWEIARHGFNPQTGRLVWVDRRRERLTLAWTRCERRPDLERVITDYRARLAVDLPGARLHALDGAGDFHGVVAVAPEKERTTIRAARWDATGARLLEAIVLGAARDAEGLARELLRGLEVTARAEESRQLRAFDVDVEMPPGMLPFQLAARPGELMVRFRRPEAAAPGRGAIGEATLHRLGMAAAWFDGDWARLLSRKEPGARFDRLDPVARAGVPAVLAVGCEAGPRWRRALGWLRVQRSLAWASPGENAVYVVSTRSSRRAPLLPSAFAVRCAEGTS